MPNTPVCLESPESIEGLSSTEIRSLLARMDDGQTDTLLAGLDSANASLMKTIERNDDKIRMETEICQILLRRMWRNIAQDDKKAYASSFKGISDEISKCTSDRI